MNFLIDSWHHPDLVVANSAIHGKGVFATNDIVQGSILFILGGVLIDRTALLSDQYDASTVVAIRDELFLASPHGAEKDVDDYINHSCDGNIWFVGDKTLAAKYFIPRNVEITADYAIWLDKADYMPFGLCGCGTVTCRRVIGGRDWLRLDVIQANYGHFAPFLNSRIECFIKSLCSHVR